MMFVVEPQTRCGANEYNRACELQLQGADAILYPLWKKKVIAPARNVLDFPRSGR